MFEWRPKESTSSFRPYSEKGVQNKPTKVFLYDLIQHYEMKM